MNLKFSLLFRLLRISLGNSTRGQLFPGDGQNFLAIEFNIVEMVTFLEVLMTGEGLNAPKVKKTLLVAGIQPAERFEPLLDQLRLQSLSLLKSLFTQFKPDLLPHLPRILLFLTSFHHSLTRRRYYKYYLISF